MNAELVAGKVVVITGASSGFGKGAALRFAEQGACLVLAARRHALLEELAHDCQRLGTRAVAISTDVSRGADFERLMATALDTFHRVDVWVNDAGVGAVGRFQEVPLEDHTQVVETNLMGTLFGSYVAMRQFVDQGNGVLINIASALGKLPAPYYSSYTASKYGVVGLSAALRQELRQNSLQGISVCTVLPMAMDTPFFEHASNYTGHEVKPIPPLYEPEQVIETIVRLASHPQDEVIVGRAGKLAALAHAIAPKTTERLMGRQTHRTQMERARQAAPAHGAVRNPVPGGTAVHGTTAVRNSQRD